MVIQSKKDMRVTKKENLQYKRDGPQRNLVFAFNIVLIAARPSSARNSSKQFLPLRSNLFRSLYQGCRPSLNDRNCALVKETSAKTKI